MATPGTDRDRIPPMLIHGDAPLPSGERRSG
jgi:hypothetical protein